MWKLTHEKKKQQKKNISTFGAHDAALLIARNMKAGSPSYLYLLMHGWSYPSVVMRRTERIRTQFQHLRLLD